MLAIEAKLDRCRETPARVPLRFHYCALRLLAAELQAQLHRLDDQHRLLDYWG